MNIDDGVTMNEKKTGVIEFQVKDFPTASFPFDRLAISGRSELLLVSLVAPTQNIKQIRAILSSGTKAVCMAGGIKVRQPAREEWYGHSPGRLSITAGGYYTYSHKLGYGQAHGLFITKAAGFLKVVTPETLWQELNLVRFTTPLLREWMPFIERRLREDDQLEEAHVFNCNCGILSATTRTLDDVVTRGLQSGAIRIPGGEDPAVIAVA